LAPHETRVVDLRKLRDAQEADLKGNKIPAAATDGSANWIRLDNVPVMGRVVVITRHGGVASNYDCCNCPCPANFTGQLEVSPSSVNLVPGGTAQLNATAVYQSCTASLYFYSETAVSSWSSQSPSVATVSAGMVTAQNGGTANITAAWTDCASWYYNPRNHPPCQCPADTSGTTSSAVLVQVPTSVSVYSDTNAAEAKCSAGSSTGCGPQRDTVWQVMDQETPPKRIQAVMSSYDIISFSLTQNSFNLNANNFSTTCGTGDKFSTGPCNVFTNAQGQTITDVNTICSTLCYSSGACVVPGSNPTTVYTQWWVFNGYKVAPHTYTMTCSKVLIDGK